MKDYFRAIPDIHLGDLSEILKRIDEKKAKLDRARPLPSVVLSNLREGLAIEWTYNSNSIEGNTLTLAETRVVIEDGITIGGKSIREHLETINHDAAITRLEDLVAPDYLLRSTDLLTLHQLVMQGIDKDFAGRLRNGMVRISGSNVVPPSPSKVSDLLDELVQWTNSHLTDIDVVVLVAIFHHGFEWIHPFFDGNGRTGRLAMNLILMSLGYPPAIILKNDRKKYYAALNAANGGDFIRVIGLVAQAIERSLNIYLNALPETYEDYRPISDIVNEEEVPYGMDYISLLARRGKISAHKEGRNWVTSVEEIKRYHAKYSLERE